MKKGILILCTLYMGSVYADDAVVQAVDQEEVVTQNNAQEALANSVQDDENLFVSLADDLEVMQEEEPELLVDNQEYDDDDQEVLLDCVRAVVMSADKTEVITQSDLERPNLTGKVLSLQERVDECRFYLDGIEHKIIISDEQIDRSLLAVQRENNMTLDDLKRTFAMSGLTYNDARELFGRLQTVNTVLDLRVSANLLVPRADVLAYYQENPQVYEAVYHLQRAVVPFADDKDVQRKKLVQMAASKEVGADVEWSPVFTVEHSEVAEDKASIHAAAVGDVIVASELYNGFELYKLVDKTDEEEVPLQDRYAEIEMHLRQPLFEKLLSAYKENLAEKMPVMYL